jgi:glucose-6-phosphate isomerase
MGAMTDISRSSAWRRLETLAKDLRKCRTIALFDDADRAKDFSIEAAGLYLDFAKNRLSRQALAALIDLAATANLEPAIEGMFAGALINMTEKRAVLHVALRDLTGAPYRVAGENVADRVAAERRKVQDFADRFARGELRGASGAPLDTFVNIGIGGSDLGPQMAAAALKPYWLEGRRGHFVSNVDGQHLCDTLAELDPQRTLFIIASKTFTTDETMANAESARAWFFEKGGSPADVAKHFVAVSSNARAVEAFGVAPEHRFTLWDWVGGRFSLWSAIGLPIALQCGFRSFERMMRGAHAMDSHFRTAPLSGNMPALLALVGIWNRNFMGASAHAILPYDQHLHRFPAFLQQLEMESNGKSVTLDGARATYATCPVLFGEAGTNGQHAFYQLLHQGTEVVSADFIAAARSATPLGRHHEKLLANFLAQPEALMLGKDESAVRAELATEGLSAAEIDDLAPHRIFPGDRPTNSILLDRLDPESLGALIALYEHKVFVQGAIWGVNSFDQWGVELGKSLARRIAPEIAGLGEDKPAPIRHDPSTNRLVERINRLRRRET